MQEENFSVYYCSVCNFCKTPAETSGSMKFCSGCKLVQYCCLEHQMNDWCEHKEFCKGVQQILKKKKMKHIYEDAERLNPEDLSSWNYHRVSVIKVIEIILKRNLRHLETQMCLFPPVCGYCHAYKPNKMFICPGCKTKMYCCEEHQEKDQNHYAKCQLFYLGFEANMLRFYRNTTLFDFIGFASHCCKITRFPKNMEGYMNSLTNSQNCTCIPKIVVSEPLSFSLTLIYIISKTVKVTTNELTIHIVGADGMETVGVQTLPLIYHLLPYVMHLNIVLIGPMVTNNDCIPLCLAESNVFVSSVSKLYHEYITSQEFVRPDIIIAFNCGIAEFENNELRDLWKNSLTSLTSFKDTIIAFTSYTHNESVKDLNRVLSNKSNAVDCKVIMKSKENPFAGLYPHRDWESEGIYFANKFISVLKT